MAAAFPGVPIDPKLGPFDTLLSIDKARRILGYEPRVTMDEGLAELAGWLEGQEADDRVAQARSELDRPGLSL